MLLYNLYGWLYVVHSYANFNLAGRYCSHEETAESESVALDCNSTLRDYLDTLNVSCVGAESDAAILTWTPDENTPDIVYYQVRKMLMYYMSEYKVYNAQSNG